MTNNDELAMKLKAAAYRVKEFGGIANYSKSVGVETAFRKEAIPDNILALLAERDADKKRIAELSAHLGNAHAFIENTEAFGREAATGIIKCGDAEWNIDNSKSVLSEGGIKLEVGG